jgi:hypothetical protein
LEALGAIDSFHGSSSGTSPLLQFLTAFPRMSIFTDTFPWIPLSIVTFETISISGDGFWAVVKFYAGTRTTLLPNSPLHILRSAPSLRRGYSYPCPLWCSACQF